MEGKTLSSESRDAEVRNKRQARHQLKMQGLLRKDISGKQGAYHSARDWQAKYGHPVVWLCERFRGTAFPASKLAIGG
jgi:hypothetical protein